MATTYFKLLSSLAVVTLCFTLIQCSNKGLSHFNKINNPDVSETNKKEVTADLNKQDPSQRKIIISGISIDVDKIPRNKALKIVDNKNLDNLKNLMDSINFASKKIYRSQDYNFFVFANNNNAYSNETEKETLGKSFIEFLDSNGKILWKKEEDQNFTDCRISANNKFVHIILYNAQTDRLVIETYNSSGDLVKRYKNVLEFEKCNKGQIIYLTTINENNKYELICYNTNDNSEWKYSSDSYISVLTVSDDEDFILISTGNYAYSYNVTGKRLWEKQNIGTGLFSISQNGKYLLRLPGYGELELYNNLTGDLIQKKEKILIKNIQYLPSIGNFVYHSDLIALCETINSDKSTVIFMKLNGEIISNTTIAKSFENLAFFEFNSDNTISIYYDGLLIAKVTL